MVGVERCLRLSAALRHRSRSRPCAELRARAKQTGRSCDVPGWRRGPQHRAHLLRSYRLGGLHPGTHHRIRRFLGNELLSGIREWSVGSGYRGTSGCLRGSKRRRSVGTRSGRPGPDWRTVMRVPARVLCLVAIAFTSMVRARAAHAISYVCLPAKILEDAARFTVECTEPAGSEGGLPKDVSPAAVTPIRFFAVAKSNGVFATRFHVLSDLAITSGLAMQIEYASGFDVDCGPDVVASCRTPQTFGILAPRSAVRMPFVVAPPPTATVVSQGEWRQFGPYSISEFRNLAITTTGTGDVDLYVRKNLPPTDALFDCRSFGGSSNESCTMTDKSTYFIGVKGFSATSGFDLTVSIVAK
jgi:hypothetical protein